jgi:hypothetical protein
MCRRQDSFKSGAPTREDADKFLKLIGYSGEIIEFISDFIRRLIKDLAKSAD